jgi:hypothetical protein
LFLPRILVMDEEEVVVDREAEGLAEDPLVPEAVPEDPMARDAGRRTP